MTTTEVRPSGSSLSSQELARLPMGVQNQTRREIEQVQRREIVAKLSEHWSSLLANTALEHVGGLTALAQHLITVAPLGRPCTGRSSTATRSAPTLMRLARRSSASPTVPPGRFRTERSSGTRGRGVHQTALRPRPYSLCFSQRPRPEY